MSLTAQIDLLILKPDLTTRHYACQTDLQFSMIFPLVLSLLSKGDLTIKLNIPRRERPIRYDSPLISYFSPLSALQWNGICGDFF